MNLWTDSRTPQQPLPAKLSVAKLKLCPLCDSLNARSNNSCFVCGWQGRFIHDSHRVHLSLVLLIEQCPELAEGVRAPAKKPSILAAVIAVLRQKFTRRQRVDFWA